MENFDTKLNSKNDAEQLVIKALELGKPIALDLFAYYRNPRTEALAKQHPNTVFISVGKEFPNPKLFFEPDAMGYKDNVATINYDALEFLELFPNETVSEAHLIIDAPEGQLVLPEIYRTLKVGGRLETISRNPTNHTITNLQDLGFSCEVKELSETDLLSDFIAKHQVADETVYTNESYFIVVATK